MQEPDQPSRRIWLSAAIGASIAPLPAFDGLRVRHEGDYITVASPPSHFLAGELRSRLQDGFTVLLAFQLLLSLDRFATIFRRAFERFAVSFDLWEERFSAVRFGAKPVSASHLTAEEAESWCLSQLRIPVSGLSPDTSFWVRVEMKPEDPKEARGASGAGPLALERLVELFGRPSRTDQQKWMVEGGPTRLKELKR